MKPVIGLAALAGEFEIGFHDTPDLLSRSEKQLLTAGFNVIKAENVIFNSDSVKKAAVLFQDKQIDILCICVGTWSEDHHLLDLLEYCDRPVVLWAYPAVDTGSLCGVQQICCVLKELNKPYFYVYGKPGDKTVLDEISVISRAVSLVNRLKFLKIGTISGRIKGMTEIAYDELEIKERTGIRIVNLDEGELFAEYEKTDKIQAEQYWNDLKKKTAAVSSTDDQGTASIRFYFAIKNLIGKNELAGLTIKCYPHLMGKVCLGYSLLSEEGIVCGCEGDVSSTVLMKILYELTDMPIHNTDLLYPDQELNTILFSHCGSGGVSIANKAENIHLAPVRLADTGVCVLFPAKTGKVSLVNLVGRKGTYRMSVMVGDALDCEMEFPGNPLKVKFQKDVMELNKVIAAEGIGHHWMGCYGDVSSELELFCQLKGIRFIRL